MNVQEYRHNNAIIRIHGTPNMDAVKEATVVFIKQKEESKKKRIKGE